MGKIVITITEQEKTLFDFLKKCRDEENMKDLLQSTIELYIFSNGDIGELPGYKSPEKHQEELKKYQKSKLLKIRESYLEKLLMYVKEYHPDIVDCGILRGPEDDYWFIDEGSILGHITLYGQYIKVIDELLNNWRQL